MPHRITPFLALLLTGCAPKVSTNAEVEKLNVRMESTNEKVLTMWYGGNGTLSAAFTGTSGTVSCTFENPIDSAIPPILTKGQKITVQSTGEGWITL